MKCNITSNNDLVQKIDRTICRYKGLPYYVVVNSNNNLDLYDPRTIHEVIHRIKSSDEDFDIAGLPLGYMNNDKDNTVSYISRIPVRRSKQGVDNRCLAVKSLSNRSVKSAFSGGDITRSHGFYDMVINKYPPLASSLETLRATWEKDKKATPEIAVTRNIALKILESGIISVFFKNSDVGYILPKDPNTVVVTDQPMAWVISRFLGHELTWRVE